MIWYNGVSVHASPALTLTVTTDKPEYYPNENVTIYGNLTVDETPVTDGLVAIQVKNPSGQTLMFRTEITGTPPSITPYVAVRSIIPCNSTGGPKDSFGRGTLAYFKLIVTNYDIDPRRALMTVSTYYSDNVPFCYSSFECELVEKTTTSIIFCLPIPQDATLGNSTAYGNAYSDLPENGGWPYCTEKSTTFLITSEGFSLSPTMSEQTNQLATTLQLEGNYNTTFKLSWETGAGDYAIYATSRYYGEEIFTNTTFSVKLQGDFDGDGDVDFTDLFVTMIGTYYYNYWNEGTYDPKADFDGDGDIDFTDLFIYMIGTYYYNYWL
jgi:hypothetical protein